MHKLLVVLAIVTFAGCDFESKVGVASGSGQILDDLDRQGGCANHFTMFVSDGNAHPAEGGAGAGEIQMWLRMADMAGLKEDDWICVWRMQSNENIIMASVYRPTAADPTQLERISTQKILDLAEVAKSISK